MRMFLYVCVFFTLSLWMGCGGGNDELIDRFCDANCNKLNECKMLGPLTLEACLTNCKDNGQQSIGNGNGCTPSSAKIDGCIAAIEAASCPFVTPAACQNLCGSQGGENDGGAGADGGGSDTTGTDNGPDSVGGSCGPVQGSCVQKKDGRIQCQEFSNQLPIAITGIEQKCIEGETTTWHKSACKTAAPGMNYGCARNSPAGCVTSYALLDAREKAASEQGCVMGLGKVVNP